MKKLTRAPLSTETENVVAGIQKLVNKATDRAAEAAKLWKRKASGKKRKAAFKEIQKKLKDMASGRHRCMYCEDNLGTDIDHFRPKATYPGQSFDWANYLLACSHCNSNEKRSAFPLDGAGRALLLDPTALDPRLHFVLVPETGRFETRSTQAAETERVFGLNRREDLTQGRADAWTTMTALVREYGVARGKSDRAAMARVVGAARRLSFQSAVQYFVAEALAGSSLVPLDAATIISAGRADWDWALR